MAEAKFKVRFTGPFVTYQDGGRPGHMRFGVPHSGPMDRLAHAAAHAALGQSTDATTIEVSMGGLVLECIQGAVTLAVAGGEFVTQYRGASTTDWSVFSIQEGETLTLRAGPRGSWCYLAFSGTLRSQRWLDRAATHSISGFGGGTLMSGDIITVEDAALRQDREGTITRPDFAENDGPIRVVMGPQDRYFSQQACDAFVASDFALTKAFDRMGVRLRGPTLPLREALSIPSEPIARGSIQVAGDGVATILLADHQTTGGYPKIATVISADLERITQRRADDLLRFTIVTPQEAVLIARDLAKASQEYLAEIAIPRGTLSQRLFRENLISGAIYAFADDE